MNIVWLTPEIPFPPIGGRNGVFNRIVQLNKYNKIFLFSIAYNEEEMGLKTEMEKYCTEVHYYNRNASKINNLLKSLFMPYSVASRTIPQLRSDIKNLLKKQDIDLIIVDFPNMAHNIEGLGISCACSLNQHNNEYKRMRDMYKIKTLPFYKRLAYLLESYRLEQYEKHIYNTGIFNTITFFSKDDCEAFSLKWAKCNADLKTVPLGANQINNVPVCMDVQHNTFLFVGRLDSIATTNVEAITWFCREVMPIVEKQIDVKVIIAGANPCDEIYQLKNKNIEIIPNYQSLESVYSLADYMIIPLLSGGGVKGKLLEAAAFNKTIISTGRGIEGTDFIPDEHVFYGNTASDFASQCVEAVKNKEKAKRIAENANLLFLKKYEWSSIGEMYNEYLLDHLLN